MYSEVFGVADNESIVRFPESEIACLFSVALFILNFWCSFLCRLFGMSTFLCRVFRVDFSVCRIFSVDFSPCTAE